ncbi:MAG: hypothetical protein KAR40_15425 [Candidatus Sabulitectum sp.]|nr:hypothetical protein [Candidatus Sabulitectum sp.]
MGVDPGVNGALAIYDTEASALIAIHDMPSWKMPVGKTKRTRVDAVALAELMDLAVMTGVSLVVIESVGGRPRQSASGGFVLGYTVGLIYMACIIARLPIETVPPATWKKLLKVPGKTKADASAIVQRADELFPDSRQQFRGPKGGLNTDRAEAGMLAYFGAKHVLPNAGEASKLKDSEYRAAYRHASTGA